MQSQQKRSLDDFFKSHGQTGQAAAAAAAAPPPRKRPSPRGAGNEKQLKKITKVAPKTPSKSVAFKDVPSCGIGSPLLSPSSHNSLPIRSPNPSTTVSPIKIDRGTQFGPTENLPPPDPRHATSFSASEVSERNQKVIENGVVVAVRDSDDDSDSLESLGEIFGRKDALAGSDSSPPVDIEPERLAVLDLFTPKTSRPVVAQDRLNALIAREKALRFDLSTVLDDHIGDEEARRNIEAMRAKYDDVADGQQDDDLDKDLLAAVVQTGDADGDEVERLLNAVERTEALSTEKRFSFFGTVKRPGGGTGRKDAFPASAIPDQMWMTNNVAARNRAYVSGYMAEVAAANDLADTALKWTFVQVTKESRGDLRNAYIQCLRAGSASWTRVNVTASDVQDLFSGLGASAHCLRDASPIEPQYQPLQVEPAVDHGCLLSTLRMFEALCPDMDFEALSKLSSVVLRLAVDVSVMSNSHVCIAVETLIEALLNLTNEDGRNHVRGRLLSDAIQNLHDPPLQVQLLRHILPSTTQGADLRKALADAFLLGPSSFNQHAYQHEHRSGADLETLTQHVSSSPSFSLTRHTNSVAVDYMTLKARTQILNVAISCRISPVVPSITAPTPPSASTSMSTATSRTSHPDTTIPPSQLPSQSLSQPSTQQDTNIVATTFTSTTAEERQFNAQVDALADILHRLFVSIKDTGASHMRRTEAKDALQALYYRLLFSVRTRPRKKKHVFDHRHHFSTGRSTVSSPRPHSLSKGRWVSGEEWRETERGGEFMKRFLANQTK